MAALVGVALGLEAFVFHMSTDPFADTRLYYDAGARLNAGLPLYPASAAIETHLAVHQGENRVIAAETDILAGLEFRSALADDDVPGNDCLAAKFFDTQSLADAVATVLDASLTFLVSHKIES